MNFQKFNSSPFAIRNLTCDFWFPMRISLLILFLIQQIFSWGVFTDTQKDLNDFRSHYVSKTTFKSWNPFDVGNTELEEECDDEQDGQPNDLVLERYSGASPSLCRKHTFWQNVFQKDSYSILFYTGYSFLFVLPKY